MHECCDIIDDAGGRTCRTCGDHWASDEAPECLGPAIERHLARVAAADLAARWIARGLIAATVACGIVAAVSAVWSLGGNTP